MKRLTERWENGVINVRYATEHESAIHRLASIEDILGDEYELDEIRKVVRCKDCIHMEARVGFPGNCFCKILDGLVPLDGFCYKGIDALKAREQDE